MFSSATIQKINQTIYIDRNDLYILDIYFIISSFIVRHWNLLSKQGYDKATTDLWRYTTLTRLIIVNGDATTVLC